MDSANPRRTGRPVRSPDGERTIDRVTAACTPAEAARIRAAADAAGVPLSAWLRKAALAALPTVEPR